MGGQKTALKSKMQSKPRCSLRVWSQASFPPPECSEEAMRREETVVFAFEKYFSKILLMLKCHNTLTQTQLSTNERVCTISIIY